MENGQTKSYNIAPYSKTSYTTATYTRKELALIDELSDANIQMALPNGLATTNRTGVRANLLAGFGKDNLVEVQGLFTKMDQVAGMGGLDGIRRWRQDRCSWPARIQPAAGIER